MLEIVRDDITTLEVDAIVNAASEALRGGGGVDGAIHRAAGPGLMEDLQRHEGCPTGSAVLTSGHRLAAKYVIHAVGPMYRGGSQDEGALLAAAYESAFRLAREQGDIRSIAFPAISAGIYGYPMAEAAEIALRSMLAHEGEMDRIVACLFSDEAHAVYKTTLTRLCAGR